MDSPLTEKMEPFDWSLEFKPMDCMQCLSPGGTGGNELQKLGTSFLIISVDLVGLFHSFFFSKRSSNNQDQHNLHVKRIIMINFNVTERNPRFREQKKLD
jgi:hypothetical protein